MVLGLVGGLSRGGIVFCCFQRFGLGGCLLTPFQPDPNPFPRSLLPETGPPVGPGVRFFRDLASGSWLGSARIRV